MAKRKTTKKTEEYDPNALNAEMFKNVNVPTPFKQLYVSDGRVVACLDANGEPWTMSTAHESGRRYWNKMTTRGRRRKTRSEVESGE